MRIDHREYPILYVDDETPNLITLRYALEDQFSILTTTSPEEALRLLEEREIAVLLADQRMPGMTGVELCEQARTLRPETVRIIITAYSDVHAAIDAINRGGVNRYITKPYRNDELVQILRTAVELVHLEQTVRSMESRLLQMGQATTASAVQGMMGHEVYNAISPLPTLHETTRDLLETAYEFLREDPEHAGELLRKALESHGDFAAALQHLQSIAERMRQGETRTRELTTATCDAGRVVDSTVRILRREMEAAPMRVVLEDSPWVPLDPTALGQVVMNLLINAAQAVAEVEHEGAITVHVSSDPELATITVADNGPGVSEQAAQRIFDPYFTTREDGSGLGLSIARKLVTDAGGELALDNSPGRGATFTVRLPLRPEGGGS